MDFARLKLSMLALFVSLYVRFCFYTSKKKYFYSSEIMMNTMVNYLREDPYFDGNEVELKLQAIIARLPKQQKIVFQMKYFQELKFREISEILGVTTGALKASFHLAKQKIIKELKSNQTF